MKVTVKSSGEDLSRVSSKVRKDLASIGVEGRDTWSHAMPDRHLSSLVPALLTVNSIEIQRSKEQKSTARTISFLAARGSTIDQIPFTYFRQQTYSGTTRLLDNSDILKGKEPVYGTLENALSVTERCRKLTQSLVAYWKDKKDLVSSGELQDADKITIQQWKPPGWHIELPVAEREIPNDVSKFRPLMRAVCARYSYVAKPLLGKYSMDELIMMDDDPPDTMTGSPTFTSGPETHLGRLAILAACPIPNMEPRKYAMMLDSLNTQLALPEGMSYSPVVSTRMGPRAKPVPLYIRGGSGYEAPWEAVGAYNRTRFVYPAPYHINFMLSPLYEWMSTARQNILGLWHDPVSQSKYIPRLRDQGTYTYSIDFSGMDTGMMPHIIMELLAAMQHAGFPTWNVELFQALYPKMGIIFPSYYGEVGQASYLKGRTRPWCSGFKLTSEMDTLYGICVLLSSLEEQFPGTIDAWLKGNFIFLELGDDIMFTFPKKIDAEKLHDSALKNWGADLEILDDAVFLKWFIPVHQDIPKLTRSIARLIQQTFYNEDRYSGIEGGDKPDAIMRLGLMARCTGLTEHPQFNELWPQILPLIEDLVFVGNATENYRRELKKGNAILDAGDEAAIIKYATQVPSYFARILDRSKYEPSSANLIKLLGDVGLSAVAAPPSKELRKLYLQAWKSTPDAHAMTTLMTYVRRSIY